MRSTKAYRPITRTESSVHVKLARKINQCMKHNKNLAGLYDGLAAGYSIITTSIPTTNQLNIREPNSVFAKLGSREERNSNLKENLDRRPAKIE